MTRFIVLLLALAGCAPRELALTLSIAPDCTIAVPAGGSLSYELVQPVGDGGTTRRQCGACLSVPTAITTSAGLLAFLRAQAPDCPIARDSSFVARVVSFDGDGCVSSASASGLCAASPPIAVGSGRSDETVGVPLSCSAGCATSCVPLSCADQGKDCDSISDTCGHMLDCGSCNAPLKCGGAGVANVCGKP